MVTHRGIITTVIEQSKMKPEESFVSISQYEQELNLSNKQKARWNGKKCIGLYEIMHVEPIVPFKYNREKNMDDWVITDDINDIEL